ncbi:hypothetical protein MHUMG1_03966 [Metarhizium humberi]|uniref:CRAL-TRIO domain-containing protein n=1 Tax=Metarhizium humberi TaxID=2596975 RepID=A0A9P8MEW2_9HYPO|nr:hypothetical protein MHUMG1_03966 [Metarhizium humberi]
MAAQEAQEAPPAAAEALKVPLEAPTPESTPEPRPELTPDQQTKYTTLLERARSISEVKCASKNHQDKSGPVTEHERAWLTRECILRYLRATNWAVGESEQRLRDTLAWRREYGLDAFTADYISPEQETGKQIIVGFDKQARPCQYLNPGRQNTDPSPRQIHHLFYMVERVVDVMPPGVEKLNLMINFKPSAQRQNTSVPVSTAREVLHILQSHYPERLGKALIINGRRRLLTSRFFFLFFCFIVPWIVRGFFKLIQPFMHPVTREKLKFNEDMRQFVPAAQLWSSDWNGDLDFEYDHAVYWPALNDMCRRRRGERLARWTAAGSLVGESEDYLAGGTDVSVGGFKYTGGGGGGDGDVDLVQEKMAAATVEDGGACPVAAA